MKPQEIDAVENIAGRTIKAAYFIGDQHFQLEFTDGSGLMLLIQTVGDEIRFCSILHGLEAEVAA